jgi:hypothetical protein
MARTLAGETDTVYRVVVTIKGTSRKPQKDADGNWLRDDRGFLIYGDPEPYERTEIYGPYATTAPARAAISRAARWGRDVTATGVVQRAVTTWEDVQ